MYGVFVQQTNRMVINVWQNFLMRTDENKRVPVISEALNFRIFRGNMPPDHLRQTRVLLANLASATRELAPLIQNMLHDPWINLVFYRGTGVRMGCGLHPSLPRSRFCLVTQRSSVAFSLSTLYRTTAYWSLTTQIKQWERNVVFGWAGVCGDGWKTSSPKNACVGGYPVGGGAVVFRKVWCVKTLPPKIITYENCIPPWQ